MPASHTPGKYKRLDGGYGWFVVLSVVMGLICSVGVGRSGGLFLVYFRDELETSAGETSVIMMTQKVVDSLAGLFIPALVETIGRRKLIFVSACLMSSGSMLTGLFSSTYAEYIATFSVLMGLGFSMTTIPVMMSLPHFWEKRLALANAIAVTGPSLGLLVVPEILKLSFNQWGFSGIFIILAGIEMQLFVVSALQRHAGPPREAQSCLCCCSRESGSNDHVTPHNGHVTVPDDQLATGEHVTLVPLAEAEPIEDVAMVAMEDKTSPPATSAQSVPMTIKQKYVALFTNGPFMLYVVSISFNAMAIQMCTQFMQWFVNWKIASAHLHDVLGWWGSWRIA